MRTCLVGQSRLFQAALSRLLEGTLFEVSANAASLEEVLSGTDGSSEDATLLLVQKPEKLSGETIEGLKAKETLFRIVLMARTLDAREIAAFFSWGVDGYLLEDISPAALIESFNLVALGEKVFPSQLAALLSMADLHRDKPRSVGCRLEDLSEREFEIVNWLARGAPNKVIAGKMLITEATVKVHIKAILKKMGVHNRTQAAIWAIQSGIHSEAE